LQQIIPGITISSTFGAIPRMFTALPFNTTNSAYTPFLTKIWSLSLAALTVAVIVLYWPVFPDASTTWIFCAGRLYTSRRTPTWDEILGTRFGFGGKGKSVRDERSWKLMGLSGSKLSGVAWRA
jgi:hypothetical protein